MPKIKLAFCEEDVSYRERFVSYLAHHKSGEAEVYAYSKAELFLEKRKEISFDVVILGEGFFTLLLELEKEENPVLVLVDEQEEKAQSMDSAAYVREAVEYLPRYQPMEVVWHRISVLAAKGHGGSSIKKLLSSVEIVGVYAPGGHEMQLFFSLLYAGLFAKECRVLYLNFMPYVNFEELFGKEAEGNMSDLILALRSEELTAETFREYICELDGISYVAPFCNPENVQEVTLADYEKILQAVMEYTDYEVVVIDFGMGMEHFAKMLASCQRILCLTKDGFFYQSQLNQFLAYVRSEDAELEKKVQVVNLPFQAKWIHGGGSLMEQLKWSEFGDFVRRNFSGGEHE